MEPPWRNGSSHNKKCRMRSFICTVMKGMNSTPPWSSGAANNSLGRRKNKNGTFGIRVQF
eukprot:scaffold5015_cov51-Attheya_sp.AAC.7